MKNKLILLFLIISVCLFSVLNTYAEDDDIVADDDIVVDDDIDDDVIDDDVVDDDDVIIDEDSVEAKIEGPEFLRTGNTLTVAYIVNNLQSSGFHGNINYDTEKLTLVETTSFDRNWNVEVMPNGLFLAYSKNPVSEDTFFSGGTLFTLTFSLSEEVSVGDIFKIDFTNVIAAVIYTDGNLEIKIPDTSYEKAIDPPASADADLTELSISGVYFSPAFKPDVTEYSISQRVSFDTTYLDITVALSHSRATYEITGNDLKVGRNTVKIIVTAENGSVKEYLITVTRAQDPSLGLSNDTRVSEITISKGTLSPAFSPDIRQYIVFLPFGTTEITVGATPYHDFALDIPTQKVALSQGNNEIIITCTAQDASTDNYYINAYVMPENYGNAPVVQTKNPLKGSPKILGELTKGSTLTAVLDGVPEGSFYVEWYKEGKLAATSADFVVTDEDTGKVIYAKFIAQGKYEGVIESIRLTLGDDGFLYATDTYNHSKRITSSALFIFIILASALFFFFGILIGRVTLNHKNPLSASNANQIANEKNDTELSPNQNADTSIPVSADQDNVIGNGNAQ